MSVNTLAKWGNSLAVRIPAKFAEQARMREGTPIIIKVKGGRLIIERARPKYKLQDLLAGYSPDDQPEELFKGPAAGHEEW
jgi:antitoxin MazE